MPNWEEALQTQNLPKGLCILFGQGMLLDSLVMTVKAIWRMWYTVVIKDYTWSTTILR